MKKILVLLVGMLLLLSNKAFAMEPYINIISPDGGDSFNVGDKIAVKWESGNLPTGDDFCISLRHSELGVGINLTGSIKDDGLENVYITQEVMEKFKENFSANNFPINKINGDYYINIHYPCYNGNQFRLSYNGNNYFSVSVDSKPFTVTYPEIITPSITVISPNGGESFVVGQSNKISWTGGKTKVKIGLVYPDFRSENSNTDAGSILGWIELNGFPNGSTIWDGITLKDLSGNKMYFNPGNGNYKIIAVTASDVGNYCTASPVNCSFDLSDYYFTVNNSNIIQEDAEHAVTYTSDLTPRISVWQGKVNQHVDIENKMWNTDPDGTSGAEIDKLIYCKKWYPKTVSVEEYKKETIKSWHDAGNVNAYKSTRMSYKCTQESASVLPSIFTMKLTSDMTSSGASRDYSARLAFVNDVLVSGTETYKVGEGGVCKENCNRQNTCVIKNGAWVDSLTGGICSISNFIPLTRSELESKIVDKKILNKKGCGHNDICYELVGNETSTISTTKINRTLKRGLRGDDVKRLQEFLGIGADGIFGYGTAAAVKKWQFQNGLTADGLFGSYSRTKAGL